MTDGAVSDLDATTRDRLAELPWSATAVYLELEAASGPRTVRQLAYDMCRPERTILSALRQLHDADLVSCSPRHADPPTSEWSVDE